VFDYRSLAPLNAVLNGTASVLLLAGFVFIKRHNVRAHRLCMITAMVVSALFLTSYLTFHYHVGDVRFGGQGAIRPVYFGILIPHIILAGVIVPLAIATIWLALSGNFIRHRRIARWTWPLWMYVSVTGVIIYFLLYRVFTPIWPPTAAPVAIAASSGGR
jgi:putative membrane protein